MQTKLFRIALLTMAYFLAGHASASPPPAGSLGEMSIDMASNNAYIRLVPSKLADSDLFLGVFFRLGNLLTPISVDDISISENNALNVAIERIDASRLAITIKNEAQADSQLGKSDYRSVRVFSIEMPENTNLICNDSTSDTTLNKELVVADFCGTLCVIPVNNAFPGNHNSVENMMRIFGEAYFLKGSTINPSKDMLAKIEFKIMNKMQRVKLKSKWLPEGQSLFMCSNDMLISPSNLAQANIPSKLNLQIKPVPPVMCHLEIAAKLEGSNSLKMLKYMITSAHAKTWGIMSSNQNANVGWALVPYADEKAFVIDVENYEYDLDGKKWMKCQGMFYSAMLYTWAIEDATHGEVLIPPGNMPIPFTFWKRLSPN